MKYDRHECLEIIKKELYTPVVGGITSSCRRIFVRCSRI